LNKTRCVFVEREDASLETASKHVHVEEDDMSSC
jgi:hypothetical protein